MTVESVCLKVPEQIWTISYVLNTLSCHTPDEYHCHQVMFIRIFYVLGPITHNTIGKDLRLYINYLVYHIGKDNVLNI